MPETPIPVLMQADKSAQIFARRWLAMSTVECRSIRVSSHLDVLALTGWKRAGFDMLFREVVAVGSVAMFNEQCGVATVVYVQEHPLSCRVVPTLVEMPLG